MDWVAHFEECLSFIEEYESLVDCHPVDFLTKNLWEECLPRATRLELESNEFFCRDDNPRHNEFQTLATMCGELEVFVKQADSLSLKNIRAVATLDELGLSEPETEANGDICEKRRMNFMSDKKEHEITVLSRLVGFLARENDIKLVIDAGAGKGYLSTCISQNYQMPVLAIDSSESNVKGAIHRVFQVRYRVERIDEETDYGRIIKSEFGDWKSRDNCILTGLHTCGQLAHSMIRHFLNTDCLKCLCVVPCCYHLTDESLTGDLILTKSARMMAQQSVERSESRETEISPSLFYRSLLQIILRSLDIGDARIGRGAPTRDFATYANWALRKIGVASDKIPSFEGLVQLEEAHSRFERRFNVFQSMRIHLGSVVEAAIVLDRLMYIRASDRCSKVALIKLFDPVISPRCYAIVASK